MLDFRKIINKLAIKVKPSECKSEDLHLRLSEYLYKELKTEGIKVNKNNVNLIVELNKHNSMIIDCMDGKIYLKGDNIDKTIGKLRRFSLKRSGETYDCAVQNAKRLINKIKSLQNELNQDNVTFKTASLKDMRKISIKDLRKSKNNFKKITNNINIVDLRKQPIVQISITDMRKRKTIISDIRINTEIIRYDYRIINYKLLLKDYRGAINEKIIR